MAVRKKRRGGVSDDAFTGPAGRDKGVQAPHHISKDKSSGRKTGASGFYARQAQGTFRQNVQKQNGTADTGKKPVLQSGWTGGTSGQNVQKQKQDGAAAGSEKISEVRAGRFHHSHTSGQNVQKSGTEYRTEAASGSSGNSSPLKNGNVKSGADFRQDASERGRKAGVKRRIKSIARARQMKDAAFRQNVQKSRQEPEKEAKLPAENRISGGQDGEERTGAQDEKQVFSEEPVIFNACRQPQRKCRRRVKQAKNRDQKKPGRPEAVSGRFVCRKDGFHGKDKETFTENSSSFSQKTEKKDTKPENGADRKRGQIQDRQFRMDAGSDKNSSRHDGGSYGSSRKHGNAENCGEHENSRNMEDSGNTENRNSSHADQFKGSAGQFPADTAFKDAVPDSSKKQEDADFTGSKKLQRKKKQAEKAGNRLEKEKAEIPKKRQYAVQRVFDEKTGRGRQALVRIEQTDPFREPGRVRNTMRRLRDEGMNFVHKKISETEQENCAVEGMHKSEQKAEELSAFVKRYNRGKNVRRQKKIEKLEKQYFKKESGFQYRKFLEENPQMKKKALQKRLQKRRIKRAYGKAGRNRAAAENARQASAAAEKLRQAAVRHKGTLAAAAVLALFFLMAASAVSSCGAVFSGIQSAVLASAYLSEPSEIDAADLEFTRLELGLQEKIGRIEADYPGYDEYYYNLGETGHDPFTLVSYLSAVYTEFTASQVQGEIQALFDEMYMLDIMPDTETGTRQVQAADADGSLLFDADGNPVMTEEEYEKSVLRVTLTVRPLEDIVAGKMDAAQTELYGIYMESRGLLQRFSSPLEPDWYPYVSSYYGYRKNLSADAGELHRGIDIAVPEGTQVHAAHDGMVTEAAYDSYYGSYAVIEKDGYATRYAHMGSLDVHAGQSVSKGDVIGLTGSTGNSAGGSLHLECLYDGEYYNPLFYFDTGTGSIYGGAADAGAGGGNAALPDSYDDASVQALMEEAAKYIGFPYVWGGSGPSTSFDCSGFVCWVFTNSGVHDLPRTTAQGIYDQCIPVAASEAEAGDIIFFTGTYNSPGPVSHVGIYCGNGIMAHAGDPISYTSINTPYWQSHYYSFGRLP